MQRLTDKLVLFGLCLLVLSLTDIRWASVIAMLMAAAVSSLNSYFENRGPIVLSMSYAAICFISPGFVVFLPLIVYDCAGLDNRFYRFCWCAALPVCFFAGGWRVPVAVVFSSGIAFLLQYRTSAQVRTRDDFFALTDDARERSALLERRNRELTEKQDYDVQLATLAERNRIAREIHDNVGHLLTRSILQLGALRVTCAKDAVLDRELGFVRDTLSEAMDSIRSSVHNLYDGSVNLRLQMQAMTDGFKFCPVKLYYDAGELPVRLRTCFAAVVREALSNIARHSDASEAAVAVTEHPAFCQLVIWDNGTVADKYAAEGIGLQNMADRVSSLGGVFRAEYNKGFRIFISVPKEGE